MPNNPSEKAPTEPFEEGEDLCCEVSHSHHSDTASLAQTATLTVEQAQRMSGFLGFLADTNRLRLLSMLAEQEMCVGDLAIALSMNESAVSHQLRTLRTIRLVSFRKQGRHVFYRLHDRHVLDFYQALIEHLDKTTA
ncbi:helix-turn-helix transcriptional regulator (plasmid) [Phormidium sp. CLA17]|uniref:ArsR/SmtB family transcription factor n=1 Tax=Leptolyngbya sp. Cla-17 TaxID=2803751 RepID=UPI0014915C62|nr:metalloregulator ArsR/SmtB family transcription factor [Leptolyngbya sp. Cla-17]MBM0745721.1 helix-turn-helix transcriptional regulator [Leptolyngbya sp. Cla-17]